MQRRLDVEETPRGRQEAGMGAAPVHPRGAEVRGCGLPQGQGPPQHIKLHFADDVRQKVARNVPEVYRQALGETISEPWKKPNLQEVSLEASSPLKFSAVIEIKPTITMGVDTSGSM